MSVQEQIDRLIVHRASEWLEALRAGRTEEYRAFVAWINESPRHLDAFLQLLALSREAAEAVRSSGREDLRPGAATREPVTEFRRSSHRTSEVSLRSRVGRAVTAAAAVACIAAIGLWLAFSLSPWKRYETRAGEQQTFRLADGSVVTLGGHTTLLVAIGNASREIRLTEGRAFFQVAHDTRRAFKVHTRDAVVQAVGTQFDVTTRREGTRVAVVEGRVNVVAAEYPARQSTSLTRPARDASTLLSAGETTQVSPRGVEWRSKTVLQTGQGKEQTRRRLILEGTPLEEAVQEFNQYQVTMKLRLEGVPEGTYHYSGTFDAEDLGSFVDALSREEGLSIERREKEIVIHARN